MSLIGRIDRAVPARADGDNARVGAPAREPQECPRGPDAVHLLVYNNRAAPTAPHNPGWTLVAWQGTSRRWSTALAAHGAGALTGARVAQAVAVRVLAQQGLSVEQWHDRRAGELALYRAVLRGAVAPGSDPPRVEPSCAPQVRVRRLGRSPGH